MLTHKIPDNVLNEKEKEKKKRLEIQAAPKVSYLSISLSICLICCGFILQIADKIKGIKILILLFKKFQLTQWLAAFGKNKLPSPKRKAQFREKGISFSPDHLIQGLSPAKILLFSAAESLHVLRIKPPKQKVRTGKKMDHHTPDGPLIVGGIPPAIMPADAPQAPNPYGYDPLASVTPLGHKQLPSAYRRTPDVSIPRVPKCRISVVGYNFLKSGRSSDCEVSTAAAFFKKSV